MSRAQGAAPVEHGRTRLKGHGSLYTRRAMSGQLSDFLSANSTRVVDRLGPTAGELGLTGQRGPSQFLNAILVALSADDMRPLTTFFGLDPSKPADIDRRLGTALRALDALTRATDAVARETSRDQGTRLDLAIEAASDLGVIGRHLATATTAGMAKQLTSMSSSSSAHGTSLSITMHELRRPLTILNSYGQLLSTGMLGELPESAQIAIDGITSSTEMMIQMVSALAELSRLEDPDDLMNLENMSASEIVDGAYEQVAPEAKMRDVTVERDVEAGLQLIGDRRRLTLALTNIVSNAVKHSPDGMAVILKVHTDEAGLVHFMVSDSGPGFPPEDGPRLFDKYFRSAAERQRKVPGSGLGLFIVRSVAERHGGKALARSEVGRGAEFEIIVPRAPIEPEKKR